MFRYNSLLGNCVVIQEWKRFSMWFVPINYKRFQNNRGVTLLSKEEQRKKKKKQKSWHWTNIWPWVRAGLDAKSDRAGWLPAVSYCSALLCSRSDSGSEFWVLGRRQPREVRIWRRVNLWFEDFMCAVARWHLECIDIVRLLKSVARIRPVKTENPSM
jgi:hypothetical protein